MGRQGAHRRVREGHDAALGVVGLEDPGGGLDGFGLIAFASLFPMMTVMGYAQLARWRAERHQTREV